MDERIKKKIAAIQKRPPSQTDGPGYIYVFRNKRDDAHENYYKIGQTERDVCKRLKEWKHSVEQLRMRVDYRKRCERLIHLYLDQYRVYRYEVEKSEKLYSVWKRSGESVQMDIVEKPKLSGIKKQVEWFLCDYEIIFEVIRRVAFEESKH